jgi:aminoglycoside phosphotransferase (APT) family kinase protein
MCRRPVPGEAPHNGAVDFVERCARSARVDLARPDVEIDQRGLQHLVLIDRGRGVVYRFPRSARQQHGLATAAARLEVLGRCGLPAPRLLDLVGPGPGILAHLVISHVPGVPLDTVPTDDLPLRHRHRLRSDLIDAVAAIRTIPVASWPAPGPAWPGLWGRLAEQVAACSALPPTVLRYHCELADAAAAVAAAAPLGVFHGDLGGVNCRIDAGTGAVTGLLDWDSAAVGDPATDIAALLAGLGPRTAADLRASSPWWRREEERYRAYVATWPIQYYLWSLREGAPQEQQEALGMLSRAAATARR